MEEKVLAGQRVIELQGAAPLTGDPGPSTAVTSLFSTPNPRSLLLVPALPPLPPPSHPGGDFPLGGGPQLGF